MNYDDIIRLPRHISKNRKHMSNADRAAQFSPFAALVGFGELIGETGRLTEERTELSESQLAELDRKLQILRDMPGTDVSVICFREDAYKEGGKCVLYSGTVKKVDDAEHTIRFTDGSRLRFQDICDILGDVFDTEE